MASVSQLSIYNGALILLGERTLASLTENREPRRVLDTIWEDNLIQHALEEGEWKFATRTAHMVADPGIDPLFGYNQAFAVPGDLVRTIKVCSDEFFNTPLLGYSEEAGIFYSFLTDVYLSYISNDPSYGLNMAAWPSSFIDYVIAFAAQKGAMRITGDKQKVLIAEKARKEAKIDALAKNAMEGPTVFPAQGTWVSARHGHSLRYDRGNRSSFYG